MKKIVFTEEFCSPGNLVPFTLTRHIQDIRVGILTIREKWEKYLNLISFDKRENSYKDFGRAVDIDETIAGDVIYLIHGNVLPTKKLAKIVKGLSPGQALSLKNLESFVYCISKKQVINKNNIKVGKAIEVERVEELKAPWDIFKMNGGAIREDLNLITKRRRSQKISRTNKVSKSSDIFIEEGATVEMCYLNASEGPVYIGKEAVVMEGAMLRGPVAVCDGAVVKMGSKIYGGTTVGPKCIVGGEIKGSVIFANSNKAHDGYMGDSVVGEWCNWGAGTSNSNIKNNASGVEVWTPSGAVNVGKKCGVFMGDYSRTAINTSINTGTVVGVCANVYGVGLTPKYIPSFAWGNDAIQRYDLDKALTDIDNWKLLKGDRITDNEKIILRHVFDHH